MSTYTSVNDRRRKNWLRNALKYRLQKCFPGRRDEQMWIFGAWEGQKYADNTKYLYEYMLLHHPEIRCFWLTKNPAVVQALRQAGKPVLLLGTPEAEKVQRQAGVALYTNGLDDFGDSPNMYGAHIVNLWHGVGFKKVYRMLLPASMSRWRKILGKAKWSFFSWIARDITVATSRYSQEQFALYAGLRCMDTILIGGQPRNDALKVSRPLEEIFANESILSRIRNQRIILYMPTFRKNTTELMPQLLEIFQSAALERILSDNHAVFLAKLHFLNHGSLAPTNRKILLNDEDVLDVQALIARADGMITDYSSCAVDYALLHRPVLFYFPDWNAFGAENSMAKETLQVCSENAAFSSSELIEKLAQMLENPTQGIKQSEQLNVIFDETGVEPGMYAENVYKKLAAYLWRK